MKYFIFLLLPFSFLFAQSNKWPPEDVGKSENFNSLKLDGDRYLPSTKKYNLVWADQLVPNFWISEKEVEFAANHYIGTQKIYLEQVNEFRKYNPNFLVSAYHLAFGLNPQDNSNCPQPRNNDNGNIGVVTPLRYISEYDNYFLPWCESNGIDINSDRFEAMFQHFDELGPGKRVWHLDPYWLMNIKNTDWNNYLAETTISWIEGMENDGFFFDVAVEMNAYFYNPTKYNPDSWGFNWWESPHNILGEKSMNLNEFYIWQNENIKQYFQNIYKKFHSGGNEYLVLPNVDQMVTTIYDPIWLDGDENGETIDGAMIEGFGGYSGKDMYLTLERCIRHITGRKKILIAQFNETDKTEIYRRTAMYMLVKNSSSFINAIDYDGDETNNVFWYPEYEIELGDYLEEITDLEELRAVGQGWESLWKREYQRGTVLVNTHTSAIEFELDTNYDWSIVKTSGGGSVDDQGNVPNYSIDYEDVSGIISIPASDGIILFKDNKSNIINELGSLIRISQINNNFISIDSKLKLNEVNIYNLNGQLLESETGMKNNSLSISNLQNGVYFIVINPKQENIYKRFTIIR